MISTRSSAEPMHLLHFLRLLAGTPSKQISADSHIMPKNNNQMISTRSSAEPLHLLHFLRLLAGSLAINSCRDSHFFLLISRFPAIRVVIRSFCPPNHNQMVSTRSSAEPSHSQHFLRRLAGTPSKTGHHIIKFAHHRL